VGPPCHIFKKLQKIAEGFALSKFASYLEENPNLT